MLSSEAEMENYELTHPPFRNWCRDCARAKSKVSPHPESSTRVDACAIQELVQKLRTCQRQGKSAPGVEFWRRVEVRHRQRVHGRGRNAITILAFFDCPTKTFHLNRVTLQRHESSLRTKSTRAERVVHRSPESDTIERPRTEHP